MKKVILFLNGAILASMLIVSCAPVNESLERAGDDSGTSSWTLLRDVFYEHRKVIYKEQSEHFLVTVEADSKGRRYMVFLPCKGSQGTWNPRHPNKIICGPCRYAMLFMAMLEEPPQRVLFIGLGAGIGPRLVRKCYPDTIIDIVEIDETVPVLAVKYFGFKPDKKMNIIIRDGRLYMDETVRKYDVVFLDAYDESGIPFPLATREFYVKVRNALKPCGIMNLNLADLGDEEFISNELKTVQSLFPQMAVYDCNDESNYVVFSGINRKLDNDKLFEKALRIEKNVDLELDMTGMLKKRIPDDDLKELYEDGKVLSDGFVPPQS